MRKQSLLFKIVNYSVFIIFAFITIYPMWNIIAGSFMSYGEYASNPIRLFPKEVVFDAYKALVDDVNIISPMRVSIITTLLGTGLSMLITTLAAYALSRKRLNGRSIIMGGIVFTMLFSGGLIPFYILLVNMKIQNTLMAMVLPGVVNTFYLIIMRTYFSEIPESLEESAKIDGANDFVILFRVILPVSMPMISTILLFVGVDKWNDLFSSLMFTHSPKYQTLQVMLYRMISNTLNNQAIQQGTAFAKNVAPGSMQMAAVVVATLPILCVYPFLQKYFVNGVMVGSIKG